MKKPFEPRKLPAWSLRTPQWRRDYARSCPYKPHKKLYERLQECKPGDSFLILENIPHSLVSWTARCAGTAVITRKVKRVRSERPAVRLWVVYPTLTDAQVRGSSDLKIDEAGPCVPFWLPKSGIMSHFQTKSYIEALAESQEGTSLDLSEYKVHY